MTQRHARRVRLIERQRTAVPEQRHERARHLLATSLYDLRQVLGDDAILATGEDLRLNAARVRSDVREFDAAIGRAD